MTWKEIKVILLTAAGIILLTIFVSLGDYIDVRLMLYGHYSSYYPEWELKEIDKGEKGGLCITFDGMIQISGEQYTKAREIYDILTEYMYDKKADKYGGYALEILFYDHTSGRSFWVKKDINPQNLIIHLDDAPIQLSEIARLFPEAKRLEMSRAYFDSIEEIQGFENLEYVDFGRTALSEEEKDYILSLYPDCEIVSGE